MRRFLFASASLALLVLFGCDALNSALEPDVDDVPPDEILTLSQSRNPPRMPADGESLDTVFARIPGEASSRTVEFSSTKGSFYRYGAVQSVSVRAESDGEGRLVAAVALRADTIPGTAIVRATIRGITRFLEVEFTESSTNPASGADND